jgi:DNA-binding LacI/PurR family transcriptional regulator/DNA-binding transcriptional regulator YhcF (GntR family)
MPRPSHLFQRLVTQLRQHLTSTFSAGEQIPSTRALAAMYGVGTMTVHRAVLQLTAESVITRGANSGWVRTGSEVKDRLGSRDPLRIGLISTFTRSEWAKSDFYSLLLAEAARRGLELIESPNPRADRTTPARSRVDLLRVPWNLFDVALLADVEDSVTLSDPRLARHPVLVVDRDATAYGLNSVTFDNAAAGRIAAQHLFELGHRRFAITDEVSDPGWPSEQTWLARRHSFEAAAGFLGGCIRPEWRLLIPHKGLQSYRFAHLRSTIELWSTLPRKRRPTAIFSFDESFTNIIATELARRNMDVPRDISLVTIAGRQGSPPKSGQNFTIVWMDMNALMRRIFDAVAEVGACIGAATKHTETPRLYRTPVLLIPGRSSAIAAN